jgi:hypothetical protein
MWHVTLLSEDTVHGVPLRTVERWSLKRTADGELIADDCTAESFMVD